MLVWASDARGCHSVEISVYDLDSMVSMGLLINRSTVTGIGLFLAAGCGGATAPGKNQDAGTLASCGSNCSPAQIAASCSATCDKIAQAGCSPPNGTRCPMNCESLPSITPGCASVVGAFYRCIESVQPSCSDSGAVVFAGCEAESEAVVACLADSGLLAAPAASGTGPSGGVCMPANECPGIPRPPLLGFSSCVGTGSQAGPDSPLVSTSTCKDSAGNVWRGVCSGSNCTCTYNGASSCVCTLSGADAGCHSCCPGMD
jgi:hypothetical protein